MPSPPQVSLRVSAVPVVTHAMAGGGIGVLGELQIVNEGPAVLGAHLRVTVTASGDGDTAGEPDPAADRRDGAGGLAADPGAGGTRVELGTVTVPVDLPAHGIANPPAVPSPLDPAAMARLTGPVAGTVRAEVVVDGLVAAVQDCPVQLLGAGQWAGRPVTLALETLAAFVQSQDPALGPVLAAAALPADAGYLDGPDRVDDQVRALAEAVLDRGITLLPADPGWPSAPQRVRGPSDLLGDRAGSALDLALLLAACLERAGLHALIWIADDGPILGYWRDDRSLPAAAVTDVDGVVNLVDLGLIGAVDPTELAGGVGDVTRAMRACGPRLHGDLSGVAGVLDVRAARRERIDPLPVRAIAADGSVHWIEGTPAAPSTSAPDTAGSDRAQPRRITAGTERTAPPPPPRVQQWKNALLDLSLRNRLLNYSGRGAVNLAVPPGLLGALEDTVAGGGAVTLLPSDRISDVQARRGIRFGRELTEELRADLLSTRRSAYTDIPGDAYQARLRSLAYRARTITEETGANHLYLALGTLVWNLDGRDLRSPVVLVPVTLVPRARRGDFRIELDEAGTSTPNYCLAEKLRQVYGLAVPDFVEPVEDAAGVDLDAVFRALRSALATAGLGHRIEQTADLALLAFAKYRLWKDLDEHWADLAGNPLVDHLMSTPTGAFADPVAAPATPVDLDALAAAVPIAADASQLDAIAAAAAGRTFVLEGPPGTGKSQTITNLLAHAVAEGRRVLFVAEKRAALDVVTRRLNAIGLAPFCLDLHDKGAKPAVVRAQIRAALDLRVPADPQGLAAATEQLRSAGAQLARYAARLHEPNAAGLSYYSAHTQSLAVGDGPVLPVPEAVVADPGADLAAVRAALVGLPDVAEPARPRPDHPWGFVDPAEPGQIDAAALATAARAVDAALDIPVTAPEVVAALHAARTPTDVANLARFGHGWAVDLALLDEAVTDRWRRAAAAARADVEAFAASAHPGLEVVTAEVFALPVDAIDADARAAAGSSWFGRKKRQLAVLARLVPALRPGVSVPRKQIADLTGRLAAVWRQIIQLQVRVAAVPGIAPPDGWNPLTDDGRRWLAARIETLTWASDAAALRDGAGRPLADPGAARLALRRLLDSRAVIGLDDQDALRRLTTALAAVAGPSGGDVPFAGWAHDGLVAAWQQSRDGRRTGEPGQPVLRRYLALLAQLHPLTLAGMHRARALLRTGAIRAADAVRAFDAGVAAAALAERAASTGLAAFEQAAHDRAVNRFAAAAAQVRTHLGSAIPAGVLASRTFDATSGFGQVGELGRELAKQRRGLAVRPLLARYGELITTVMPCMLVSPDSLARFLPPRAGLFDLVVFDEASQIRVADAIGALGRARAAVVVGDSQQMPPTSVAESTADPLGADGREASDTDDAATDLLAVPDEESILSECVQAGVPRRWLSWHYRSQDEALIAFSNRRYYADRLSTFPSPLHGAADPGPHGHGVSLIRVPGEFLRSGGGKLLRTNPTEAAAVVTEIRRRFRDTARPGAVPSIGVVTFNAQQRTLIEALLRDLDDDAVTAALDRADGEGLFVKNLENVQGDERDVILFSTAFAANARGVLPLNFGPLNQLGGERRLNVAITRARRQILVFSSFDPADLRAEETTSQGIKDLRAYLELARAGTGVALGPSPKAPAPDRHRDAVAAAVSARGMAVTTNVGLSDFTLDLAIGAGRAPGTAAAAPRVAVLLDGPEWAARRTVGDRDGLPAEVLAGLMGWPSVQRVWLPDWLRDSESVVDRLVAAADGTVVGAGDDEPGGDGDQASHSDGVPGGDEASQSDAMPGGDEASQSDGVLTGDAGSASGGVPRADAASGGRVDSGGSADLPGEEPFTPWMSGYLGSRYVLDQLPAAGAARQVTRALADAVTAEGPVHVDRLARLVAGGFDLSRVSTDRRAAILRCLPAGLFRDPADQDFAWPAHLDPISWAGFRRTGPHADRPLEQVSGREIGNAMVAICAAGAGLQQEQLETETLRVFGFHRRTAAQLAVLDRALQRALREGRLRADGSLIVAP